MHKIAEKHHLKFAHNLIEYRGHSIYTMHRKTYIVTVNERRKLILKLSRSIKNCNPSSNHELQFDRLNTINYELFVQDDNIFGILDSPDE